ncbi:hypothetical protein GIB67_034245 [Kingdonia uniflora]|uniref:UBA domain-containing protein n=1 Tax=Kingdonia uniflora TaxID=39325 RepID=A0A7J7NRY1_9MAGN|nr:hypothetical protein GIB67_034245 [Kingdonia uniflora]
MLGSRPAAIGHNIRDSSTKAKKGDARIFQSSSLLLAMDGGLAAAAAQSRQQKPDTFDEEIQMLVAMGFEKTQVEVAIAAADGDSNVAVEILMTQQA